MLGVSTKFHQAFKESDREIYVKIHVNGMTYSADKIKSMEYSSGALGGESFQIGSTQSAALKITFTEIIEGLKELDTITVELGIKIKGSGLPSNIENVSRIGSAKVGRARLVTFVPDKFEFVPLGTFYISDRVDPNRNEGTTTLEARDGFIFMEGAYESKLSYPTRLANVAIEIANKSGVKIDPVSFNHLSTYTISKPEGYTYRQAIGLIGQYEAGFVCFDRNGQLAIRQLTDPKFFIAPSEYFLKGLTKNELLFQPKGISCKVIKKKDGSSNETITLQAGSTNGPQITIENNTMTQSLLEQIFTKVKNLNYYPIDLKWRGNPALEVGDWVTMTDRMGKNFKTPILNYTLVFDGGLTSTISADSKSQSGSVTAFKGPLQQQLENIDYRLDAAGKNNVYSGTAKPKNPQEGDIWFKKDGPDDEIWVYQKLEDGSFDWVMTTSTRMADEIKEQIENATPSDEIVKTINLSPEMDGKDWLKISGAKIWLTNETKIDKAIITSAMIAEVDAGKIRTGTLDASQITVTNLNANSISTGIAKGKDLSINFDTGAVDFSRGKIIGPNLSMDVTNGTLKSVSSRLYNNKYVLEIEEGKLFFKPENILTKASTGIIPDGTGETSWVTRIGVGSRSNAGLSLTAGYYLEGSNFNVDFNKAAEIDLSYIDSKSIIGIRANEINFAGVNGIGQATVNFKRNVSVSIIESLKIHTNLSVVGSKNAIHPTRDGVRATPAYELAESYLGDIGRHVTNEECSVWVPIDTLFSDTVNTDLPYEVFLQSYDNDDVWVSDFKSGAFLVCSHKPNTRFVWEIKAKRRGYENERLKLQGMDNNEIDRVWGDTDGN
ncbi:gp58-like family protein [Enterococcus sp. AZ103]|uniref:gp58-like family protein n=1 Tax=Enterococcus sp. AZ103 TaxID=2774628 RepID=UPI003F20E1A2